MHEHPIVHSCMNYENVKKNIKVSSVYFPGGRNNIIINILSINTILQFLPVGLNCEREIILSRPGWCSFRRGEPLSRQILIDKWIDRQIYLLDDLIRRMNRLNCRRLFYPGRAGLASGGENHSLDRYRLEIDRQILVIDRQIDRQID